MRMDRDVFSTPHVTTTVPLPTLISIGTRQFHILRPFASDCRVPSPNPRESDPFMLDVQRTKGGELTVSVTISPRRPFAGNDVISSRRSLEGTTVGVFSIEGATMSRTSDTGVGGAGAGVGVEVGAAVGTGDGLTVAVGRGVLVASGTAPVGGAGLRVPSRVRRSESPPPSQ